MADLVQNVTSTVLVLGTTSKWGILVWGVDNWGEANATEILFTKVIQNSQTIDQALSTTAQMTRTMTIGTAVVSHDVSPGLSNGIWDYVIDLSPQTWGESTINDATFTCQAAAGTSWSEV